MIRGQAIHQIAVEVNKEQRRVKRKRRLKQLGGAVGAGFGALAIGRLKGVRRFTQARKEALKGAIARRAAKLEAEATTVLSRMLDNAVKQSVKGIFRKR